MMIHKYKQKASNQKSEMRQKDIEKEATDIKEA